MFDHSKHKTRWARNVTDRLREICLRLTITWARRTQWRKVNTRSLIAIFRTLCPQKNYIGLLECFDWRKRKRRKWRAGMWITIISWSNMLHFIKPTRTKEISRQSWERERGREGEILELPWEEDDRRAQGKRKIKNRIFGFSFLEFLLSPHR